MGVNKRKKLLIETLEIIVEKYNFQHMHFTNACFKNILNLFSQK